MALSSRSARKPRRIFVLALAALLGELRYNLAQPHFDQASLATYDDQPKLVLVEGVVVAGPDVRDVYINLRVEADRFILTTSRRERCADWRSSKRPVHRFSLRRPREGRGQGFAPLMWLTPFMGYAFEVRATLTRVIAQTLRVPEPQASLLTGILLGDDAGIPKSVQGAFCTTGTSHIIAISG